MPLNVCRPKGKAAAPSRPTRIRRSDETTKFLKQLFNWRLTARASGKGPSMGCSTTPSPARRHAGRISISMSGACALSATPAWALARTATAMRCRSGSRRSASLKRSGCPVTLSSRTVAAGEWGYCYPFGSRSAFSQETERAVAEAGCPFAFAFEARDIETRSGRGRALCAAAP